MTENLNSELQFIKGIGPKRAQILKNAGIKTLQDLLYFFPRKYIDRSQILTIDQLLPDQEVTVLGEIKHQGLRYARTRQFYMVLSDGHGYLEAIWFQGADYFKDRFKVGEWVALSGKVTFFRGFQMAHPDYDRLGEEGEELVNTGKVLAFYPSTELFRKNHLTSYFFRRIFQQIRDSFETQTEFYPQSILKKHKLAPLTEALYTLHNPQTMAGLDPARNRIIHEDFFLQQLILLRTRHLHHQNQQGIAFEKPGFTLSRLYNDLPFQLTEAQKRVMREIRADMKKPSPMNRLLQGDVGSGKTLVALMALLIAVDNGYQGVIMAPTEILAEQHFYNFQRLLQDYDIPVSLLTGSTKAQTREFLMADLSRENPHIVVGTHAVFENAVHFKNLGLVVIDEQHRFGVSQRTRLMGKNAQADLLVMTATPIPRTLALTVYGSLDTSIIDEMPPGRQPIVTAWRNETQEPSINKFIGERLAQGEQVFVVFPLVEESEKIDLQSAAEGFERFSRLFPQFRIGLLHGRLSGFEKDEVMRKFAAGEINLLVATTVIEVGVDVPNATVMLIEHAERFGLSQLHQLRGRIGRGKKKSWCILKTVGELTDIARRRIEIMTETNDGFKIAEVDLELRGWGDFFGTRQSGLPEFRMANIIRDRAWLEKARQDAGEILAGDPGLEKEEHQALKNAVNLFARRHLRQKRLS